jgi:hypothetical protein
MPERRELALASCAYGRRTESKIASARGRLASVMEGCVRSVPRR